MGNDASVGAITVVGGNLFQVAATQFGSAMQWVNIAQANGLRDPQLFGATNLSIPRISAAFADGISPQ